MASFPPTPAPSPGPSSPPPTRVEHEHTPSELAAHFGTLAPPARLAALSLLVSQLSAPEISALQALLAPLFKRDFLAELPTELAFAVLGCVDGPKTLARAGRVSRRWRALVGEDGVWRAMCARLGYGWPEDEESSPFDDALRAPESWRALCRYMHTTSRNWLRRPTLLRAHRLPTHTSDASLNTITSAALSRTHLVVGLANARIHLFSARTGAAQRTLTGHDNGVWAVCLVTPGGRPPPPGDVEGLPEMSYTPAREVRSGLEFVLRHNRAPAGAGVDNPRRLDHLLPPSMRRALGLDMRQPQTPRAPGVGESAERADATAASRGWGQPAALVVSGGSDKDLRVWDADSGLCLYVLRGHTSTVRTLRVLPGRPVAVSGARDGAIRVWDIRHGRLLRRLDGHGASVRALETCGRFAVSGSYDCTVRLWDVDSGKCVHVFSGHDAPIYCVAFDGRLIASGGVDTSVRLYDASSGESLAKFSTHTALVCQLQLAPGMLVSGGADGRVVLYAVSAPSPPSLSSTSTSTSPPTATTPAPTPVRAEVIYRLTAHDSSITALQLVRSSSLLVTSGNDGRARLWDLSNGGGRYVREMSDGGEGVWGIAFRGEAGAVLCKRQGKMVVELWSFQGELETRGREGERRLVGEREGRGRLVSGPERAPMSVLVQGAAVEGVAGVVVVAP